MVEMASSTPVRVFRVLDREGQPIGQIIRPKVGPVVGRGARTVLLVRTTAGSELARDQVLRAS
jgi:hypothetical protein